ncbi:LMBR1-like membrane protein-domain-containing protein [Jimgerdemannia flammicorona]|uniref:LMBR1-like membrane protein-domain-containing protein n=1 Tax=Jimgerdemannia flammicorona TaxID=994334 RepID=A0A433D8C2_9FUNG|nr:LMBR1-like membrane protein-domain-containing protein [Jimgerdemannia flammicorona]
MNPTDLDSSPSGPFGSNTTYIPLIVVSITLIFLVYFLVSYFANTKSHPWYVKVTTLVGWFFPFWIVFLLPLDLASTMYEICKPEDKCKIPFGHVSQQFLFIAWRTVYWTAFGLTWAVIPLMQSYVDAGEFTFGTRFRRAIKENLKFYLVYAVLGIAAGVYLIVTELFKSRDAFVGFVMAMANSWGLLLAILFMGYGLVSIPRQLWNAADTHRHLTALYMRASKAKDEYDDAKLQATKVAKEISYLSRHLPSTDPLHPLLVKILKAFPPSIDPQTNMRDPLITSTVPQSMTVTYLAGLNQRMKRAVRMRERYSALWKNLLRDAFKYQDIITNAGNTDRRFHSTVRKLTEPSIFRNLKLSLEWWWYIHLRGIVTRFLAIICGILSIALVWSELTFNGRDPVLSLVAIGLRAGGLNYAVAELYVRVRIQLFAAPQGLQLLRTRAQSRNRRTKPAVVRGLSVQVDFMGKADLVPFLGSFVDWFPMVILIPVTLQLLNIQNRLLRICGMHQYEIDDDDQSEGQEQDTEALGRGPIALNPEAEEGRMLIDEERHAVERKLNPGQDHQRDNTLLGRNRADAFTKYNRGRQPPRSGDSGSSRQSALDVENSYSADPNTTRLRAELLNSRNRDRASRPGSTSSRSSSLTRSGLSREDRDRRIDELNASRKGKTIGAPGTTGAGAGAGGRGYRAEEEEDADESNESSFFRLTSRAKKGFGDLFRASNNSNNEPDGAGFSGAGASGDDSRERLLGRGRTAQRQDADWPQSQPRRGSNLLDVHPEDDMDPLVSTPSSEQRASGARARSISPNPFTSSARASGGSGFGGAGSGGGFGGGGGARVSPFTRFEGPSTTSLNGAGGGL